MKQIIRVIVPVDSQEPKAFRLALAYAEQISKGAGIEDIILPVNTKHHLERTYLSRL